MGIVQEALGQKNSIVAEALQGQGEFPESEFQSWYKGWADYLGLNQNPDDPRHFYDYRAAYRSGKGPSWDARTGEYHWPSEFKKEGHPRMVLNGVNTKTGMPEPEDPFTTGGTPQGGTDPFTDGGKGAPTGDDEYAFYNSRQDREKGIDPFTQSKVNIAQAAAEGKIEPKDIPLAVKIADFFTGHFPNDDDTPELEITPDGKLKVQLKSGEMSIFNDPMALLAPAIVKGGKIAGRAGQKILGAAREYIGWLTGGASEVPGLAKKGVEGAVKAASEPATAERMAKLREAGLDVPLRGEIPTSSVSPSVASAPVSRTAQETSKETTGAVSGQSKEPWQMTREEYAKPPLPPQHTVEGSKFGGFNEPIQQHEWWRKGKASSDPKKGLPPQHCARCGQEIKNWYRHGEKFLGVDCYYELKAAGDIAATGASAYGSKLPHKKIIEKALSEGKPVPAEALKDYPEVAEKFKNNFVKSGESSDLGGIGFDIEKEAGIPSAPIRMLIGDKDYGAIHIAIAKGGRRLESIKEAGYSGVSDFVGDVAKNYSQIWEQPNGRLMLAKRNGQAKLAVVELKEEDGYYSVTTALIADNGYPARGGRRLLWERSEPISASPEKSAPLTNTVLDSQKSQVGDAWRSGQSKDNVPPNSAEVKSIGKDPAFAPEKDFRRKPIEEIEKTESAEMVKRSEIVDFLRQKLDVPIRTGRFRGKALGIFKIKPEVVRSKMANDIETISHEIGHALQKHLYPESMKGGVAHAPADWKIFGDELKRAATQPNKASDYGTEGFAEFIRMYVTDPKKAKTELPNFYDYFDKQLATKSPEAREILLHARDQYDKWLKQPAKQRVLSQISVGEKDYKRPLNFTSLYTKAFDELHPLKKAVEAMAKGKDLKMAEDPYALARLMPGWTGKADAFLEYKPFNYKTYQFEGKSLKEILEPMKDNLDDFRSYIISRRAIELKRRGIESGILPKDAAKIVKEDHKKYGQAFDDLKEYQDRVLNYLADSGVLDKKALAKMRTYNKDYVPFYRVMEEGRGAGKGAGKGLQAWSPIKKIRGSSRDIVDPLESIIKNTYLYVNLAEKNAVGQALVRLAAKNEGMGKYVERIPTSMQRIKVSSEEVRNYLNRLADDVGIDTLPPEIAEVLGSMDVYRKSPFQPKDNVISVFQNGKKALYEVHPEISRTMQALDQEQMNSLMRMLSIPSRLLRAGATLTPEFMARNPIRDQWTAYIYSKYGFKPGVDLFRGVAHMIGKDDIYWKWKISGGEHSMLVSMDREYLQKNLKDLMTKYGIDSPETYKYIVKHPIDTLRILSEFGEQGTRIGEFAKGIAKEGATKEGIQKAGFASREVTLDFARKGTWGKHVNQLVAFWNANMQGPDKMIRAFKEAPGATAFRVGASITLPSIGLYLYNRTDGRWEDIPQWQKDLFWVVIPNRISKEDWKKMSADDKAKMLSMNPATSGIYRIPKPFEIGILFGSMPERLAEYILSQDPKAFDGYLKSAARGLSPGIMPNIGAPLIENWANKSFFFDRPLIPQSMERLLPEYQAGPHVTETAKAISKAINRIPGADEVSSQTSPAGIENIIRGWTGGLGQHALNIVDEALKKAGVVPEKVKPSRSLSDIPLVKAFTVRYPSASAESVREFYDNYKKMDQTVSTARYLARKKFDPKEASDVLEAGDVAQVNKVYQALQRQQQVINAINELPSITPEEKRRLIDTAYFQMIDVAKAGNEIFKKTKREVRWQK